MLSHKIYYLYHQLYMHVYHFLFSLSNYFKLHHFLHIHHLEHLYQKYRHEGNNA